MYLDYEMYLINLRNNLIACGVEFPDGATQDLTDYSKLFKFGYKLQDILLYYKILSVSGSEHMLRNFYLPIGDTYRNYIRGIFYKEFVESVLPNYKSLVGDTENISLSDDLFLDDEDEQFLDDLFSDKTSFDEDYAAGTEDGGNTGNVDLVSNNVFLDIVKRHSLNTPTDKEDKEYVSEGVILEDFCVRGLNIFDESPLTTSENVYSDIDEETPYDEEDYSSLFSDFSEEDEDDDYESLFLDEESPYDNEEDDCSYEDYEEESPYEDYEEDSYEEAEYGEDFIYEEESPYEDYEESDYEESPYEEYEEESYEDEGDYEEYEEESPYEDYEESDYEESPYEDEDDDYEESDYEEESPYVDEDDYEEYEEESPYDDGDESSYEGEDDYSTSSTSANLSSINEKERGSYDEKKDVDLGDELQDITNAVLTKIKRTAISFLNRKE